MGSDPGAVVALDPNNGQVLVMYSSPNFDPNSLVNSDTVSTNFTALLKDPGHPLINRAIQGLYAPGSTAKPFLALEDLDSGIITPDFSINDTGTYQIPGTTHVFHNWNLKSSGKVDLATAIMESNDTFFFTVANLAGPTRMHKILDAFGFGEKPGLDLTHVYSGALPNPIESHGIWHWNKIRWWPRLYRSHGFTISGCRCNHGHERCSL
jgi:penicillin-binding protein 2